MRVLSIETSCDDTGVAVLEIINSKFATLSNIVSSQQIHQNYGGVFPMMAKREHQKNLTPVLKRALQKAKLLKNQKSKIKNQNYNSKIKNIKKILERESELLKQLIPFLSKYEKPDVDFIAVTNGPGLEPCLWVGVNFARALSFFWNISIVPVNHIEAHILVNFLGKINEISNFQFPISKQIPNSKFQISEKLFPAIALVVSGGHTQLILMKGIPARNASHSNAGGGKYKIIGETRDDAAGECFDKCAKILGLGYPGGPAIAKIALQWKLKSKNQKLKINLPRPMINSKDYDFSFSGLKTAVLYETKGKKLTKEYVAEMCIEIQQAIIDVLIKKTIKAAKDFGAKTIILGGGVSANTELRKQLARKVKEDVSPFSNGREKKGISVIFPEPKLSTDNALMIAVDGYFNKNKKISWKTLKANANLRV